MNAIVFWAFWSLLTVAIYQIGFTIAFIYRLKPTPPQLLPVPAPKVTVILCLRGADPFLAECLQGLWNQDYPNFTVQIIVDSPTDPAWDVLNQVMPTASTPKVQVSVLQTPKETCSLKCSAILQAIANLEADCEIIAFLDADVIPYASWLRDLVIPLQGNHIAATTGNRWYIPDGKQWGTLIRYLWNASAIVTMYFNTIPWGGSLAIKTQSLWQADIPTLWAQTLSDEVPLYQAFNAQKLKIQFVPSVLLISRENCSLDSFLQWVTRQYLMMRLYHPSWWSGVFYSANILLLILVSSLILMISLVNGNIAIAQWIGFPLIMFFGASALLLPLMERSIQRLVRGSGETLPSISLRTRLKLLAALPFCQVICTTALLSTLLIRTVQWRGIRYSIKGPWNIRLLQYFPCTALARSANPKGSL